MKSVKKSCWTSVFLVWFSTSGEESQITTLLEIIITLRFAVSNLQSPKVSRQHHIPRQSQLTMRNNEKQLRWCLWSSFLLLSKCLVTGTKILRDAPLPLQQI